MFSVLLLQRFTVKLEDKWNSDFFVCFVLIKEKGQLVV